MVILAGDLIPPRPALPRDLERISPWLERGEWYRKHANCSSMDFRGLPCDPVARKSLSSILTPRQYGQLYHYGFVEQYGGLTGALYRIHWLFSNNCTSFREGKADKMLNCFLPYMHDTCLDFHVRTAVLALRTEEANYVGQACTMRPIEMEIARGRFTYSQAPVHRDAMKVPDSRVGQILNQAQESAYQLRVERIEREREARRREVERIEREAAERRRHIVQRQHRDAFGRFAVAANTRPITDFVTFNNVTFTYIDSNGQQWTQEQLQLMAADGNTRGPEPVQPPATWANTPAPELHEWNTAVDEFNRLQCHADEPCDGTCNPDE